MRTLPLNANWGDFANLLMKKRKKLAEYVIVQIINFNVHRVFRCE